MTRLRLAAKWEDTLNMDLWWIVGNFTAHNLGASLSKHSLLGLGEVVAGDAADAIFVG